MATDYTSMNSSSNFSIDGSINRAKNNSIILDNIVNHYLFEDELHMSFSVFKKYEQLIMNNLVLMDLPKEYWYRPEYMSYYYYNTTDFWYLGITNCINILALVILFL